ncbi:MAG: flagellar hook protein FlgE [Myxococcota bacterium]
MSLLSSLFSGWSGLRINSLELSVVGDNIANANTIGFKGSRAEFEEALAQTVIGSGQVGMGAGLQTVHRILSQGALMSTGQPTDLALQGPGFFMVKGAHNGVDGTFYTRAGQFTLDQDGYLVNHDGLRVQGYSADGAGNVASSLGDLHLGDAPSPPRATSEITLKANLQADAAPPTLPFDPNDPEATSNFNTSVTVYDSLGKAHDVQVYFRKNTDGQWEWHALTDGGGLQGGAAGVATEIASGALSFDGEGRLVDATQTSNFNPAGATGPQPLSFNFGDPLNAGGTGLEGITQFAATSEVRFMDQDGYTSGTLAMVQINEQGMIMGTFSNGETRALGQVAVADFSAPEQLSRAGGNLYTVTGGSGAPTVGAPGSGGRGSVAAGALEQSNVDLAAEFIRMISAQRGFQANSKTISTADQLLGELMQLKR